MIYLRIAAILFLFTTAASAQAPKSPKAKPATGNKTVRLKKGNTFFERTFHNYGNIKEDGGLAMTSFIFSNYGNAPVKILNVTASCGCTIPDWTKEEVPPGGTGSITVMYDPKGRPGEFSKTLTVNSTGDPAAVYLAIKGKVITEDERVTRTYPVKQGNMRFTTDYADFKEVKELTADTLTVTLYNSKKDVMRVLSVEAPTHIRFELSNKDILPEGGANLRLIYYASLIKDMGERKDEIRIITSDDSVKVKRVITNAYIVPDFSQLTEKEKKNPPKMEFVTTSHDFGTIFMGEKVKYTFEVANKGKSPLVIKEASAACGCTVTNITGPVTLKKGQKTKIEVTFDAGKMRGQQEKTVTIFSNDPSQPVLPLKILANVVVPGGR